jgi:hypothetical protein
MKKDLHPNILRFIDNLENIDYRIYNRGSNMAKKKELMTTNRVSILDRAIDQNRKSPCCGNTEIKQLDDAFEPHKSLFNAPAFATASRISQNSMYLTKKDD